MNGTNPYDCASSIALEVDFIYTQCYVYVNLGDTNDFQRQENI